MIHTCTSSWTFLFLHVHIYLFITADIIHNHSHIKLVTHIHSVHPRMRTYIYRTFVKIISDTIKWCYQLNTFNHEFVQHNDIIQAILCKHITLKYSDHVIMISFLGDIIGWFQTNSLQLIESVFTGTVRHPLVTKA